MKKHVVKDGQCINLNKRITDLKLSQREFLDMRLKDGYLKKREETGKPLNVMDKIIIIENVYDQLQEKAIWIPFEEVKVYFSGKINHYEKCFNKLKNVVD